MSRLVYRPRHPVTGRRIVISARTPGELAAHRDRIESLRTRLSLGTLSVEEVMRELRRTEHGSVTLERAARLYIERPGLAPNTRRRIRSLLATHLRELALRELDTLDGEVLSGWLDKLRARRLGQLTIGTAWRGLRAVVRYAAERGLIGAAPWGAWRPVLRGAAKREPREAARSLEELERLRIAALELDQERELLGKVGDLEAKIAVAALLGLRRGELAGLRWPDVERTSDGPTVLVARQYDGRALKNNAPPRRIVTIPELLEILARYRVSLERHRLYAPRGPIFPCPASSSPGAPAHYTQGEVVASLHLRSAATRAGLPSPSRWSSHSLRDTFVTLETHATGGDLAAVAARSGHGSIASLARYLRARNRPPAPPAIPALPTHKADGAGPPDG
jgi:integrase